MFRGIGLKLNWRLQVEDWIVVILLFFYLETLNWRLQVEDWIVVAVTHIGLKLLSSVNIHRRFGFIFSSLLLIR